MSEQYITLAELVGLVAYLGAPAFAVTALALLSGLRVILGPSFRGWLLLQTMVLLFVLAIPLSTLAWHLLPEDLDENTLQILDLFFLPAVIGAPVAALIAGGFIRWRAGCPVQRY